MPRQERSVKNQSGSGGCGMWRGKHRGGAGDVGQASNAARPYPATIALRMAKGRSMRCSGSMSAPVPWILIVP
jgi:hypothetical protein